MLLNQSSRRLPRWFVPVLGSLLMMPILPTVFNSSTLSTQQIQSRPSFEEPISSTPNQTGAALAIVALGAGILGLSWRSSRQSSSTTKTRLNQTAALPNRSLQRQLLSLLHNDHQAANRLIQQTKAKHPDRSIDWCAEKVIYDLQRDRH
jgi:hypothetical protein